jgi:hypothetical protein
MKKAILLLALGCGSAGDDAATPSYERYVYTDTEPPADQVTDTGAAWDCLGETPAMAEREPGRVQYVLPVVDFGDAFGGTPEAVANLNVQVCADPACSSELALCSDGAEPCYQVTATEQLPYVLKFDFPFAFDGTLRFSAPGYVDLDYVLGGPMVGQPSGEMQVIGGTITMLSTTALAAFYTGLGQSTVDTMRGVLMLRTLDCQGQPSGGLNIRPVSGDFESPAVPYRLSNSNPISQSLQTPGVAGVVNLQPQSTTVAATVDTGAEYARASAIVRASAITLIELRSGLGVWGQ